MIKGSMTDPELVAQSLNGNREAFGQIITRYQSLICSLAYSATGSLGQSEDLAQETFITAWKRLGHLREHNKLRAWLCGIARFLIGKALRRDGREPAHRAEPLEAVEESADVEPLPSERAITKEEAEILWRSIERIPETYREPLVLFYREHQSIRAVAMALDLTEDTVKQRLYRGRKMLQAEVLAFVEGALGRTNPGKAFTLGVLAALPLMTFSAKAAVVGATAVKGGAAAKAAGVAGFLTTILGPLLVLFGNYVGYRLNLETARTDEERKFTRTMYKQVLSLIAAFTVVFVALVSWGLHHRKTHTTLFLYLFAVILIAYVGSMIAAGLWVYRRQRKLFARLAELSGADELSRPAWEYRSQRTLLGLPLVHICIGDRFSALSKPVVAWIAAGDRAFGGLFAFGGLAIAPFSIGGCAVGLVSFGGMALGILTLAGLGIGIWCFSGVAIGWQAFGGCAVAWSAAFGGISVAHDFAVGSIALAAQANNEPARQFIEPNLFFHYALAMARHAYWLNLIWVIPLVVWWKVVQRKQREKQAQPPA